MAECRRAQGRLAEAEALLATISPEHLASSGSDPYGLGAAMQNELGTIRRMQGRNGEAIELHRHAAKQAESRGPAVVWLVVAALDNIGRDLVGLGRLREARPNHEQALARAEKAFGTEDARVSGPLAGLAALTAAEGNARRALELYQRALTLREKRGKTHPELCELLDAMAPLRTSLNLSRMPHPADERCRSR